MAWESFPKNSRHELLERLLKEATDRTLAWDRESYDNWLESQCAQICQLYANSRFTSFCVGQAQKWLKMSVKYALTLNALRQLLRRCGISSTRYWRIYPYDCSGGVRPSTEFVFSRYPIHTEGFFSEF